MADAKTYPNKLRFDLSATQIGELVDETIAASAKLLDEVVAKAATAKFVHGTSKVADSPIQLLADEDAFFSIHSSNVYFPSQVSTDAAFVSSLWSGNQTIADLYRLFRIREASVAANTKLEKYGIEKEMREDVYKAIKGYIDQINAAAVLVNPKFTYEDILDKDEAYFTKKIIQGFERNGFSLPAEKREKLKALRQGSSLSTWRTVAGWGGLMEILSCRSEWTLH